MLVPRNSDSLQISAAPEPARAVALLRPTPHVVPDDTHYIRAWRFKARERAS